MIPQFKKIRLTRIFRLIAKLGGDVERLDEEDFIVWGREVAKHHGILFSNELKQCWIKIYKFYCQDPKGVSLDDFLRNPIYHTQHHVSDMEKVNFELLKLVDVDDSGSVDFNEYYAFLLPLGISKEDAEFGFRAIFSAIYGISNEDTLQNCEHISLGKLALASARYANDIGQDSPFRHFWGTLNH